MGVWGLGVSGLGLGSELVAFISPCDPDKSNEYRDHKASSEGYPLNPKPYKALNPKALNPKSFKEYLGSLKGSCKRSIGFIGFRVPETPISLN